MMLHTIGGINQRQRALLGVRSKAPLCRLAQLRAYEASMPPTLARHL